MSIKEIFADNVITLSLIIGMSVVVLTNRDFDRRIRNYFICFIYLVLLLVLADMADYYMAGLKNMCWFRYITSSIGYTLRPSSIVLIICVLLRRKKLHVAIWIPVGIVSLLSFTSQFTHIMFEFNEQNEFVRGPLGYLPHLISGIYMFVLVVLSIRMLRLNNIGEMFTIIYIAILSTIVTCIETFIKIKFLIPGIMIVSCTLYYIFLYVQTYKRDVLTGLLNRRSFSIDTENMRRQPLVVISMDFNGLKEINDQQGHQAGDTALCTFANICITAAQKEYRVYRIGGDEFIALGKKKTIEQAEQYIQRLRETLKKTGYMASFGYALYTEMDEFDDICNYADSLMYEDKKKYKQRVSEEEISVC